ncbi:MAG: hypothetical protein ABI639_13330 [Thermoanaerobaculia bacterium]
MKTPVLLAVSGTADDFAPLFSAAAAAGVRFGWLALDVPLEPPAALQSLPLRAAFRAVAVGSGRSIAVKPMKGKAVLRDLLREHFLGAEVVFVSGSDLYPRLSPEARRAESPREIAWHLAESATASRVYTTVELLVRLRKPALRWKAD